MGSWPLRIEFVSRQWRARGHQCILLNIGASRKLKDPNYLNIRGPLNYLFNIAKAAAKGHVIHTHTNAKGVKGTLLALSAQFISCLFGRRCVLTFHAGVRQQYFPKTGKFWLDCLMSLTLKTPRYIICNSQNVKDRIVEDYGIAPGKVHPIPSFCSAYLETQPGDYSDSVRRFVQQHDPVLVSYVFFFHAEFAVDMMVQAASKLREKYLRMGLIIMGSKKYVEDYLPLIKELDLAEHILLTGNLPRPEFLRVLADGALYLRTPIGDGVAASVLEALSLRTPVVASDNGTRPEMCILYEPGNFNDMVDKISYTLDHRKEIVARISHSSDNEPIDEPSDRDTLEQEVDLLLSVASGSLSWQADLESIELDR